MTGTTPSERIVETYVVTGGTRGIGYGISRELLLRGQNVFLCGRSETSVNRAIKKLEEAAVGEGTSGGRVGGIPCDISSYDDVQKLWDAAIAKFGTVHVWINNAAIDPHAPLLLSPSGGGGTEGKDEDKTKNLRHVEQINQCIDINIKGAVNCCRVAIQGMKKQQQHSGGTERKYRVYLMEGLGSDGSIRSSITMVYGMTKYAGTYLANAIEKDLSSSEEYKNISLGRMQPGMVTTDLLLSSMTDGEKSAEEIESTKKIFNILADKEETVTPWIADQLVEGNNLAIRWLTTGSVLFRFVKSLFVKRDLFEDE